jgi:hypothetical protein
MTGSKRVDHRTRGTVCECGEIAGSPQTQRMTTIMIGGKIFDDIDKASVKLGCFIDEKFRIKILSLLRKSPPLSL